MISFPSHFLLPSKGIRKEGQDIAPKRESAIRIALIGAACVCVYKRECVHTHTCTPCISERAEALFAQACVP
jgi:hypothetical protein